MFAILSGMDQFDRDSTIADFKNGVCNLMVRLPHIMLEIKFILDLCFETLKSPHVFIGTLSRYNSSSSRILSVVPQIATSVAARGLDVKQLILVVNYDCPNHYEDYVHRCG